MEIYDSTPVQTKEIVVVMDSVTGDQAIYVDGKFSFADTTIYPIDIAKAAGDAFIKISQVLVSIEADSSGLQVEEWPKDFEKLEVIQK